MPGLWPDASSGNWWGGLDGYTVYECRSRWWHVAIPMLCLNYAKKVENHNKFCKEQKWGGVRTAPLIIYSHLGCMIFFCLIIIIIQHQPWFVSVSASINQLRRWPNHLYQFRCLSHQSREAESGLVIGSTFDCCWWRTWSWARKVWGERRTWSWARICQDHHKT